MEILSNAGVNIKVQLTSEADLFFHYEAFYDEEIFAKLKSKQQLSCNFSMYHNMLIKLLNDCKNRRK